MTFSALAERLPAAVAAEAADVERALALVAVKARNPPTGDQSEGSRSRAARRTRCETTSGFAPKAASTPSSTGTPGASTTPRSPRRRGYGCEASGNGNKKKMPPRERTPTTERTPPRFHPTDRHEVPVPVPVGSVPVPVPVPGTFAWSPATLLRAPPPPPEPFGRLLRFTRHVSLATFARDALCFLRERPECADLQDLGISAMALVKAALEPSASPSASSDRGDREAYLAALFRSPLGVSNGTSRSGNDSARRGVPRRARGAETDTGNRRRLARGGLTRVRAGGGVRRFSRATCVRRGAL